MNDTDELARAAKHLDATDIGEGRWAYYAEETGRYYVVEADALEALAADYLDSDDEDIRADAYSHWCAGEGSDAKRMPTDWSPGDESVGSERRYSGPPCECGAPNASWHGDTMRAYLCGGCARRRQS